MITDTEKEILDCSQVARGDSLPLKGGKKKTKG